jgi:hypothetical protein
MSLIARNLARQPVLRNRVLAQSRAFHGPYTVRAHALSRALNLELISALPRSFSLFPCPA